MSAPCPRHPGVAAAYTCSRCQQPCCLNCCYSMPDASICCSSCYGQASAPKAVITPALASLQATPTSTPERGCPQHPLLPPVAFCKVCGKGSCVTCDFFFPPSMHLCPVCVVATQGALTPLRRKYMITAFVMAAVGSIGAVVSLSGMLAGFFGEDNRMAAVIVGLGIIVVTTIPTTVGTGVAWAALRKGGPNPMGVWIALIWNILILGTIILMMVMNSLMS